jgi:putative transcriptional regulator
VNKRDFDDLVKSVRQAGRIRRKKLRPARVMTFKPANIKAIRDRLGTSQSEFAMLIGVSVATLRNWEQGRRVPDGPAQVLLRVVAHDPEAVVRALSA